MDSLKLWQRKFRPQHAFIAWLQSIARIKLWCRQLDVQTFSGLEILGKLKLIFHRLALQNKLHWNIGAEPWLSSPKLACFCFPINDHRHVVCQLLSRILMSYLLMHAGCGPAGCVFVTDIFSRNHSWWNARIFKFRADGYMCTQNRHQFIVSSEGH